jgi:hypothetical protein
MSSNTSVIFDEQLSVQDNHGSLVNILAWFLLIASSLTVFTRIATKWLVSRKFNLDDGMILLSLVSSAYSNARFSYAYLQSLSVGQTVATSLEVHYGLGQHIESLSAQQILSFQKACLLIRRRSNTNTRRLFIHPRFFGWGANAFPSSPWAFSSERFPSTGNQHWEL